MRTINLIPKSCTLRIGNDAFDFKWYDRPEQARKIFYAYFGELTTALTESEFRKINNLVNERRKCIDLDIALDILFSAGNWFYPRPRWGGNGFPGDCSENTRSDLAMTQWEENTCHDAYLVKYVFYRDQIVSGY